MYADNIDYGYSRCSTNEKKQDVEYQIKWFLDKGIKRENIFIEYESGGKENRTEFNKLLRLLKNGDSIHTTDITRLSRSTKQLCELVEIIESNKYRLVIGSMEIDCRSEKLDVMVEGMLKMMGVFAELERKLKVYQINLGLENARAKGKVLGRPNFTKEDIPNDFYKYYTMFINKEINKLELSRLTGKSRPTVDSYIKLITC